jgi:hypothetical protein
MEFISGENRNQIVLLPEGVEDYVDDNNPVRVIEVYINGLDLAALGFPVRSPMRQDGPCTTPKIC